MELVFVETWLLGPLLLLAVALGGGLLVRRLAGGAVSAVLVLPVGYALAVAVATFLTTWDATAELAGPACCALAIAGLVAERAAIAGAWRSRGFRAPPALWGAAVAFCAFSVVAAPVVLTGHLTYTGYARIVDIAHQFDFTRWLTTEGRSWPVPQDYSYGEVVAKTLYIGYPAGGQSTLGAFARLLGVDIPWFWQVFMAFNGAMLGLALYALLGRAIENRPARALAAIVASQPNILYGYALVGGIKEFTSATFLVTSAALLPAVLARPLPHWRATVPLGVAVAAAVAAFSLTIGPWLGVILAGVVLILVLRRDRWAGLARVGLVGAVALAAAAPTAYLAVTKLLPVATQAEGGGATVLQDLGNLGAAMPVRAVTGVWISGDYRLPAHGERPLTNLLIAVALVLIAAGVVRTIRRRDWPLALLGTGVALAVLYYVERTGPWIQFKALTTSAPVVLALAFVGAAELAAAGRRLVRRPWGSAGGLLAGAAVACGVILGNAYAYHEVTLAPHDRLRDLQHLGDELRGGPALHPSWEEAGEYFLRRQRASARPNGFLQVRDEVPPEQQFDYDIDDMKLDYVQAQELLIVRRGPTRSRPPANFTLVERTEFYDVWRRTAPATTVVDHVPLPGKSPEARAAACKTFAARAARRRPGERLAYVQGAHTVDANLGARGVGMTPNFKPASDTAILMSGPGRLERGVGLRPGTYDVWLAGAVARPLTVSLDGRRVGVVSDAWTYPGGWSRVGAVTARGGDHVVRLDRPGGGLAPGDGADDQPVGPLTFVRREEGRETVRYAPLRDAGRLCRRSTDLDWVEIVRGLGPDGQLVSSAATSR